MGPDEPIEHELLRNAVATEVTVTSTDVSPTSTGDGYIHIERAWATTGAPSRSRRRRALPPRPRLSRSGHNRRTGTRRGLTGAQGRG